MDLKKKVGTIIGIIVAIWILCPLPELSIISGLIFGKTIVSIFNFPWWYTWVFTISTIPVGWLILHKSGLLSKIRQSFNLPSLKGLKERHVDTETESIRSEPHPDISEPLLDGRDGFRTREGENYSEGENQRIKRKRENK